MVAELLRQKYRPCEPIVLSDVQKMQLSSGSLRQTFKRLADKGVLKRYMNGVYYLPQNGTKPSEEAVLSKMYLENKKEIYGYAAGRTYGKKLGVTKRDDTYPIVVTNKENSRGRFRMMLSTKVYLRKPYTHITKDNAEALALLDFIREWEMYSDLSEEETFEHIREYIKLKKISRGVLAENAAHYPGKVFTLLVKHKLVRF